MDHARKILKYWRSWNEYGVFVVLVCDCLSARTSPQRSCSGRPTRPQFSFPTLRPPVPLSCANACVQQRYASWTEEDGGGEVTHGLGLIGAAFGLAVSVGPILGGSLSELHRGTACVLCAAMSGLAILSLRFYGWKETAPERSVHRTSTGADESGGAAAGAGRKLYNWCSAWRVVNPFTILKVFMESR